MKNKIVVIGSSNIDFIMKMDHLPKKGETVADAKFMQVYGGKGANQAVAAAQAGGNAVLVSCVGDDIYGRQMIQNFQIKGIDTRFIFSEKDVTTGHALIMVDKLGENIISVAPGANQLLNLKKINLIQEILEEAAIILMQFEIPEETIKYVVNLAHKKEIPVMWNFAPAKKIDFSYISKIDILVLNKVEMELLTGIELNDESEFEKAGNILIEAGVEKVIVTLGNRGLIAITGHTTIKVPGYKVNAIDTTAAGDIFCGTFAVACTQEKSFRESLCFASAASAISVTRMGAQTSVPSRLEIENFLRSRPF